MEAYYIPLIREVAWATGIAYISLSVVAGGLMIYKEIKKTINKSQGEPNRIFKSETKSLDNIVN